MLNIILYGLVGIVLAMAGVSILTQPAYFCLIIGLIVAIDLSGNIG